MKNIITLSGGTEIEVVPAGEPHTGDKPVLVDYSEILGPDFEVLHADRDPDVLKMAERMRQAVAGI